MPIWFGLALIAGIAAVATWGSLRMLRSRLPRAADISTTLGGGLALILFVIFSLGTAKAFDVLRSQYIEFRERRLLSKTGFSQQDIARYFAAAGTMKVAVVASSVCGKLVILNEQSGAIDGSFLHLQIFKLDAPATWTRLFSYLWTKN